MFYVLLIVAFNYFYVAIQYNPVDISNQLRKNNGTIPGIRPGKPTSDFITKTLSKITLIGGIFLAVVAGPAHRAGQRHRRFHPAGRYQPADRCRRGAGHGAFARRLYDVAPSQRLFGMMTDGGLRPPGKGKLL